MVSYFELLDTSKIPLVECEQLLGERSKPQIGHRFIIEQVLIVAIGPFGILPGWGVKERLVPAGLRCFETHKFAARYTLAFLYIAVSGRQKQNTTFQ